MKRKIFLIALAAIMTSCAKEKATTLNNDAKVLYVRVKQVSKDGNSSYSTTLRIVRSQGK